MALITEGFVSKVYKTPPFIGGSQWDSNEFHRADVKT